MIFFCLSLWNARITMPGFYIEWYYLKLKRNYHYYYCMCMYVCIWYVCTLKCMHVLGIAHTWNSEDNLVKLLLSFYLSWVLEVEFRSSGVLSRTCWASSVGPNCTILYTKGKQPSDTVLKLRSCGRSTRDDDFCILRMQLAKILTGCCVCALNLSSVEEWMVRIATRWWSLIINQLPGS